MKFKGYNFPHHVEIINSFSPTITENTNNLNIKSEKIDLSVFSKSIQDFIKSKNADIICEIQCSDTFFRRIEFVNEDFNFDFIIDKKL